MSIVRLSIAKFRNISQATLRPSSSLNVFYGANGSGKTSLLECISTLSLGRSFRSRRHKNLVQFGQSRFSLFADIRSTNKAVPNTTIGLERGAPSSSKTLINGETAPSSASLAQALPIQWMDADTFQLLSGGPNQRRAYIDWAVFHVKHSFSHSWSSYQACLKQRNSLLKRGKMQADQLVYWDQQLCAFGEQLSAARAQVLQGLVGYLLKYQVDLLFLDDYKDLTFQFDRGWPDHMSLAHCLAGKYEQDCRFGFTTAGPHKAELKISVKGRPAFEVLSRGQQKALVSMMKFAQVAFVQATADKPIVLLLDDMSAELDRNLQTLLARWVGGLEVQCFVTGISRSDLMSVWSDEQQKLAKVFHVKHGEVTEEFPNGEVNDR